MIGSSPYIAPLPTVTPATATKAFAAAKPVAAASSSGFLSQLNAGFTAAAPYLWIAQMAFSVFAESRAKSKAKRDARESTAVKLKSVQTIEANATADVLYGIVATQGQRVYIGVQGNSTTIPFPPATAKEVGRIPADPGQKNNTTRRIKTHVREFYLAQYVLSVGETGEILDLDVDDRRMSKLWNNDGLQSGHGGTLAGCWKLEWGVASTFATAFIGDRTVDSKFVGLSAADFWAQAPDSYNSAKRIFRGTPRPLFHKEGRKLMGLSGGARTAFDEADPRWDNAALCLIDYLQHPDYGPNLPDKNIDFASFQTFHDQCERALLEEGGASVPVRRRVPIWERRDEGYQARYEAAANDVERDAILAEYYAYRGYGGSGVVPGSTKALKRALGKVRWGSCCSVVKTSLDFQSDVEQIIQGVPGAVVSLTVPDKLRVSAPPWDVSAANQSVKTITDDLLRGPVQLADQPAEGRYNRYSVTYNDIDKRFHETTETWSDSDLVDEDGDVVEYEERVASIGTAEQARTLARSRCLVSRRMVYEGVYSIQGDLKEVVEPNEVFRVQSTEYDVDAYLLMKNVVISEDRHLCSFRAIEFVPTDYGPVLAARFTEFEVEEELKTTGALLRLYGIPTGSVPAGTAIPVSVELIGTTRTLGDTTWTGASVAAYGTVANARLWTPTAADSTLTVAATVDDCELEVSATVEVAAAASPTVEIVPFRKRWYSAAWNGFAAAPTCNWSIDPPTAGGTLSSATGNTVEITGGHETVRGELSVECVNGTERASDTILLPLLALDPDHGGENVVDGEEVVF